MHPIKAQFLKDMQVAGLSQATQHRYEKNVNFFFKTVWCAPEDVTEEMVKDFIIGVRDRDVARETFRGYVYALKCLFLNTMHRDWDFLKKTALAPPPSSAFGRR